MYILYLFFLYAKVDVVLYLNEIYCLLNDDMIFQPFAFIYLLLSLSLCIFFLRDLKQLNKKKKLK